LPLCQSLAIKKLKSYKSLGFKGSLHKRSRWQQ
jgi:hypothetical protein